MKLALAVLALATVLAATLGAGSVPAQSRPPERRTATPPPTVPVAVGNANTAYDSPAVPIRGTGPDQTGSGGQDGGDTAPMQARESGSFQLNNQRGQRSGAGGTPPASGQSAFPTNLGQTPVNGIGGTGGGRYSFGAQPGPAPGVTPSGFVNVEASNRDHIDQDARTPLAPSSPPSRMSAPAPIPRAPR